MPRVNSMDPLSQQNRKEEPQGQFTVRTFEESLFTSWHLGRACTLKLNSDSLDLPLTGVTGQLSSPYTTSSLPDYIPILPVIFNVKMRTSLVVQRLGIHMPVQGHGFDPLVRDPTCHRATKSISRNSGSLCTLEPVFCSKSSTAVRSLCTATRQRPPSLTRESPRQQQRLRTAK